MGQGTPVWFGNPHRVIWQLNLLIHVRHLAQGLAHGGFSEGQASRVALVVKNPPANAGDARDEGSIPGSGRSPEGGHGNPL